MLLRLLGISHHKFCTPGLGDGPVGRAQPELSPQNPCNSDPRKAEAGGIPGVGLVSSRAVMVLSQELGDGPEDDTQARP